MRVQSFAVGAVLAGLSFQSAHAQTATANFQVLINILKACIVSSATDMDFGTNPGVIASPINQTSTISLVCTGGTAYSVGLNAGTTAGATETTRQMAQGAARINYALYSDTLRTVNWGNTVASWVTGTGTGLPQNLTVYGQVPAQTATATGGYTDTITVTVTY